MAEKKRSGLLLVLIGILVSVILWGGFNTAVDATNTETFAPSGL